MTSGVTCDSVAVALLSLVAVTPDETPSPVEVPELVVDPIGASVVVPSVEVPVLVVDSIVSVVLRSVEASGLVVEASGLVVDSA